MENTIMNEEVMEQVTEATTENLGKNIGMIGIGILAASAVAALCYKGVKVVKAKKNVKLQVVDGEKVDNVKVAEHDFLEKDSEEEE